MRPRDLPRQCKAQPGPLNAAAQGVVSAIKLFENLFFAAAGNAQPAVEDFEFGMGQGSALPLEFESDLLVAVGLFFGVGEEVDQDLG